MCQDSSKRRFKGQDEKQKGMTTEAEKLFKTQSTSRENMIPESTETLQYQLHRLLHEFGIHFPLR